MTVSAIKNLITTGRSNLTCPSIMRAPETPYHILSNKPKYWIRNLQKKTKVQINAMPKLENRTQKKKKGGGKGKNMTYPKLPDSSSVNEVFLSPNSQNSEFITWGIWEVAASTSLPITIYLFSFCFRHKKNPERL